MNKRVSILGVPVDALRMNEAVAAILALTERGKPAHIMTPNPEMIVAATRMPEFLAVLKRTALNVPDGAGLLLAARFSGARLPERVAGADLVERLADEPALQPLFLLGGEEGIAERAASALKARHPHVRIAGMFAGSPAPSEEAAILERINASGAVTLLVAYGAPAQDLWIDRILRKLTTVRIAMGVGGTLDFLAGKRRRAPGWLRALHLEWAWRLIQEPSRLPRIFTAVVVFPLMALTRREASRTGEASRSSDRDQT